MLNKLNAINVPHRTKPGVKDITIEEYHAGEGISRSGIMTFKQSPYHYWHKYINPTYIHKEPTEALIFGNALHTYILEPKDFENRYILKPKIDRRTTKGKEEWDKFMYTSLGRQVIDDVMLNKIIKISEAIKNNSEAKDLIDGAQFEKSVFWNDPSTGILCKARPDIWHTNMIVDLKTTMNASPREFQRAIYNYGYHIQAGMIQEALRHTQGVEMTNFVFLVVEKEDPHACAIYVLDELAIEQGVNDFKKTLVKFKECLIKDHWESYQTQVITLPAYASYGE